MGTEKSVGNDIGKKPKLGKGAIIGICAGAAVIVIGLILFFVIRANNSMTATTIRLLRMQGTVNLFDDKDKSVSITKDMRLKKGNKVQTMAESFASMGLDDYKIISLDENSSTDIKQKGKKLEVKVKTGGVYFNVTKPLEDDETLDISTSTMIVGIRGTCGYVSADELFLIEGHVLVTDENGETYDIYPGDWLSRDKATGKYQKKKFTLRDLPLLVISELARDDERRAQCLEVCGATEEEFWEYADTLEPAYFDWADLNRLRPANITEEEKPDFSITTEDTKGGKISADLNLAKEGDTVTLTAVCDEGYKFYNWILSCDAELTTSDDMLKASFTMPAENVTVKAEFIEKEKPVYGVTAEKVTGGTSALTHAQAEPGTVITISAKAEIGYYFAGWVVVSGDVKLEDSSSPETSFIMPEGEVKVQPKFNKRSYGVKVSAGKGGKASANATSADYGQTVTLTANPENGFIFEKWTVESPNGLKLSSLTSEKATFTMPADNVSISASFVQKAEETEEQQEEKIEERHEEEQQEEEQQEEEVKTFSVSISTVTGGTASADPTDAKAGDTVTISATASAGYTFVGWRVTSGSVTLADGSNAETTFTMPESDVVIVPEFSPIGYKVTVTAGNGGSAAADMETIYVGDTVTLTATPSTGYAFAKWTVKSGSVTLSSETDAAATFTADASDVEIEATFTAESYGVTVSASPVTGGTVTSSLSTAEYGTEITITATPATGYAFSKWSVTEGGASLSSDSDATATFTMPASNVTVEATFTAVEYSVSVSVATPDGGTASADVTKGTMGTTVTLTATPATGYKFAGWSVKNGGAALGSDSAASTSFSMPASDVNIEALFAMVDYSITVSTVTGGSGSTSPVTANYGNDINLTATADTGYTFTKWNVTSGGANLDNANSASTSFRMPASDVVLEPVFTANTHSISVTGVPNAGGSPTASAVSAAYGTQITLEAKKNPGYNFDRWSVVAGGVTLSSTTDETVTFVLQDEDVTIDASYNGIPYTITVTSSDTSKGTVTSDLSDAIVGDTVTLTPTAASAYKFSQWNVVSGNVTISSTNNTFTMPAEAVTIEAVFGIDGDNLGRRIAGTTDEMYLSTDGAIGKYTGSAILLTSRGTGNTITIPKELTDENGSTTNLSASYVDFGNGAAATAGAGGSSSLLNEGDIIDYQGFDDAGNAKYSLDGSIDKNNITVKLSSNTLYSIVSFFEKDTWRISPVSNNATNLVVKNDKYTFTYNPTDQKWHYEDTNTPGVDWVLINISNNNNGDSELVFENPNVPQASYYLVKTDPEGTTTPHM